MGSAMAAFGLPAVAALSVAVLGIQWRRPPGEGATDHSQLMVAVAVAITLASVAFCGAIWYQRHLPAASATDVSHFIGDGPARVRGVVEGDRDERERSLMLRLRVTSTEID